MAYNVITATKREFVKEVKKMAEGDNGRDKIVNFGHERYGRGVNNFFGTPTSVMVDEIIEWEEEVSPEYRWKADIFYY